MAGSLSYLLHYHLCFVQLCWQICFACDHGVWALDDECLEFELRFKHLRLDAERDKGCELGFRQLHGKFGADLWRIFIPFDRCTKISHGFRRD